MGLISRVSSRTYRYETIGKKFNSKMARGKQRKTKKSNNNDSDDFDDTCSNISASTRTTNVSKRSGASSAISNFVQDFGVDGDDCEGMLAVGIELLEMSSIKRNKKGLEIIINCMRSAVGTDYTSIEIKVTKSWQTISDYCFR